MPIRVRRLKLHNFASVINAKKMAIGSFFLTA